MENTTFKQQFLTSNLYTSTNEVEILDALVDNGLFPKQFERTQVFSFLKDEDFYLIIFMVSATGHRGFLMYKVMDFSVHLEELYMLSSTFSGLMKAVEDNYPYRMAKHKIDEIIGMAATFRALFHKTIDADDYSNAA
jgi:hypothetical protein